MTDRRTVMLVPNTLYRPPCESDQLPVARPVYSCPKQERKRLAWVAARNVVYNALRFVGFGRDTAIANRLLGAVWAFPKDAAQ